MSDYVYYGIKNTLKYGDMLGYNGLRCVRNSNPHDEIAWRKRPVKSRVCGLKDSMVRQEYDKINSLNGLK